MTHQEDLPPEAVMRELAEILATGYLRLRGHASNFGENLAEVRGSGDVTVNTANGSSARNLPS